MRDLRSVILGIPETLQEFNLAADDKYWEGMDLLNAGKNSGAVYMLGYCAEMTLKAALFYLKNASPLDEVQQLLNTLQANMKQHPVQAIQYILPEGNHSLRYWAILLEEQRKTLGCPFSGAYGLEFAATTERLYNNWTVKMRYRHVVASSDEALRFVRDVGWLRTNYNMLRTP
jgi:hypothetical protein